MGQTAIQSVIRDNESRLDERFPGWAEIAGSQEFGQWASTQSRMVQDALRRNANAIVDYDDAADILQRFTDATGGGTTAHPNATPVPDPASTTNPSKTRPTTQVNSRRRPKARRRYDRHSRRGRPPNAVGHVGKPGLIARVFRKELSHDDESFYRCGDFCPHRSLRGAANAKHAAPVTVLDKFGMTKPMPKNKGVAIKFRRRNPFLRQQHLWSRANEHRVRL